jgi:hypothetical protein
MTSADAAAFGVLVIVPLALVARALVRRSRGQPFTRDELVTAVGAIGLGLVAIALTRSPSIAVLLPAGLAGFGLLLVIQTRAQPVGGSLAGLGYAAIAAGALGLVVAIVRTMLG